MAGWSAVLGVFTGLNRGPLARILRGILLALLFTHWPHSAEPQMNGDPLPIGHYRVLESRILQEDRILQVHLPRGYETGDLRYPVIYLLYSNFLEGYFSQAVNDLYHLSMDRMPPAILVGVPNTRRYRDLLPWPSADGRGGEAERFLTFVRNELIPFVDGSYRTQPYRVLVGPQAAGVFGAYALLEAPGTFQAFILNDPCGLDGEERSLCQELAVFSRSPAADGTYLSVSHDRPGPPSEQGQLEALEAGLRAQAPDGFRWRIHVQEDWPFFLPPIRIRESLLDLFRDYPFPHPAQVSSAEEIRSHYADLSRNLGFEIHPPDLVLTLAGNGLMDRGALSEALEVFSLILRLHPASLNGPWGMANLHRLMGDTASAISFYEECLRRDPNITPARDWLVRLGGIH